MLTKHGCRCGKSVVGEAIAFALGGSKTMLRTKQLSALINANLSIQHLEAQARCLNYLLSCSVLTVCWYEHQGTPHWIGRSR